MYMVSMLSTTSTETNILLTTRLVVLDFKKVVENAINTVNISVLKDRRSLLFQNIRSPKRLIPLNFERYNNAK